MIMKNDTKIEEELTYRFKIYMRNLTNFDPSPRKSPLVCTLNGLLLTNVCVCAKEAQRSYLS